MIYHGLPLLSYRLNPTPWEIQGFWEAYARKVQRVAIKVARRAGILKIAAKLDEATSLL